MTRDEADALVWMGCLPLDVVQDSNFNWELPAELFVEYCGRNYESDAPWFPEQTITQDVWAKAPPPIEIPAVVEEPFTVEYANYVVPTVQPESQTETLRIEKEVYAPSEEDRTMPGFEPVLFGGLEGLFGMTLEEALSAAGKGVVGGIAGTLAGTGLESLFGLQDTTAVTKAPKATLITGACPPGRVVRKIAYGRDICIRKPKMNPLNPKALRRATTRISRFHHFAVAAEKEMAAAFRKGGFHPGRAVARIGGKCGSCRKSKCSCG
jgi:hypothetical protein